MPEQGFLQISAKLLIQGKAANGNRKGVNTVSTCIGPQNYVSEMPLSEVDLFGVESSVFAKVLKAIKSIFNSLSAHANQVDGMAGLQEGRGLSSSTQVRGNSPALQPLSPPAPSC